MALTVALCLRLLSVATAIFTDLATEDHSLNYRLPQSIMPEHYSIKLTPHITYENLTLDGESSVAINVQHPTRNISLHAHGLMISQEAITLSKSTGGVAYKPQGYNYRNETQILVLVFENVLAPGLYTLNMKFGSTLDYSDESLFRTMDTDLEGNRKILMAMQFKPTAARRAFPCWDEPAFKATFNISIKHPRSYTALSNMPMREQTDGEDGMLWTHFDTTPAMSTYLLAIAMTDLMRVPNENGSVDIWCKPTSVPLIKFAQNVTERVAKLLTWYTNSTTKIPKTNLVVIPGKFQAMQYWGLIIYSEQQLIYDDKFNYPNRKIHVSTAIAHEMAHQWFGNLVSPSWWTHIWLNEGFASYFEIYIVDKIFKNWRTMDFFVVQIQQLSLHRDIDFNAYGIVPKATNEPIEVDVLHTLCLAEYTTAPSLIRMLQHVITEDVFRKGILEYLNTYKFRSTTPDDLWNTFQSIVDNSYTSHNKSIRDVMVHWLKQTHYPLLTVTRNYHSGKTIISQRPFKVRDTRNNFTKWWVPITIATQSHPDFSKTSPKVWLRPQDREISFNGIDSNDWMIVNLQQVGYYRVNYDITNWRMLGRYLNSKDYANIHVLNRAQIIDDAYHLLMEKELPPLVFFEIISYLKEEADHIPWYPVVRMLKQMSIFFQSSESEHVKTRVLEVLDGLLENIGYEKRSDDNRSTRIKRLLALHWACKLGHTKCLAEASKTLTEHLENPEAHTVLPLWKHWTYCTGMVKAGMYVWLKMLDKYMATQNKEILEYMTCTEDHAVIMFYLERLSPKDSLVTMRNLERLMIYRSIVEKHVKNDILLDFILANFHRIRPSMVSATRGIVDVIMHVRSKEQLEKIKTFLDEKASVQKINMDVAERAIEIRSIIIERNVAKFADRFNVIENEIDDRSIVSDTVSTSTQDNCYFENCDQSYEYLDY